MRIVVVGGGIGGLSTAMLLGRDGHGVTVLERDPAPPPASVDAAWTGWERTGVNQFRLLHFFLPRFRAVVESELPEVADGLAAAGAARFNQVAEAPDSVAGGWIDGDERFDALTARRPVVEDVLARAAASAEGVEVRRGVSVEGLVADGAGRNGTPPHVTGVRLDSGEELSADLVVDASGRRSPLPRWLEQLGATPCEQEVEDSGFVYYGRYFRSADGSLPAMDAPLLSAHGSVSILTLPADNGTWGVGIITSSGDAALRGLKDNATWERVLRGFPGSAGWGEGEPLQDVVVMAKIEDRHRHYVVDGDPVATGVVSVADSWACTNPSLGRGATIGLLHALALRDVLRDAADAEPRELALRFDEETLAAVEPWYRVTLEFDRHRLAEMKAAIAGQEYDPGDPTWDMTNAMQFGALSDGTVLRGFLDIASLLAPTEEVMARPGMFERVIEVGSGWRDADPGGAGRAELLELVDA